MIKLIVGLGNPGKNYQEHRHNAGLHCDDVPDNFFRDFPVQQLV